MQGFRGRCRSLVGMLQHVMRNKHVYSAGRWLRCVCSFLLQDASVDLRVANPTARSPHRREVVLPDGVHNLRGYVKPPSADVMSAFKEDGKFSKVKSGMCESGICTVVSSNISRGLPPVRLRSSVCCGLQCAGPPPHQLLRSCFSHDRSRPCDWHTLCDQPASAGPHVLLMVHVNDWAPAVMSDCVQALGQ